MANRRHFSRPVKREIHTRATGPDGIKRCENPDCRRVIVGRNCQVAHNKQDALEIDKSRKLTAADGRLLCTPCHKEESRIEAPILAKALRTGDKAAGIKRSAYPPIRSRGFHKSERASRIAREKIDKTALPILPRKWT